MNSALSSILSAPGAASARHFSEAHGPEPEALVDDFFQSDLRMLREKIEARLASLLPATVDAGRQETDVIASAIAYGVTAPGKRMRPLLMLLVARGLGHTREDDLLDLCCAVEMVHAASLFLDDMPCMDNARLRRGRPSVHARYGEDAAVLGAVALLAQAWRIAATAEGIDPAVRNRMVVVLSDALGLQGLVRGQYRDLREDHAQCAADDIATVNHQKTGALFAAALELTGLACGAPPASLQALREAACELGQAFQLRDDLEDGTDDPATPVTKDRHQDDGKTTLVALLGRERAAERLTRHLHRAETCLSQVLVHDDTALWLVRRAFAPQLPATKADVQTAL